MYIEHDGVKRKSGRYPWGSGEVPYQHESWFSWTVKDLRSKGYSDTEIAKQLNMSTTEFRAKITTEKSRRAENIAEALKLVDKGWSNVAIAEKFGVSEGAVRDWRKNADKRKVNAVDNTADILRKSIDERGFIDVGSGIELYLGISDSTKKGALKVLEEEGYKLYDIPVEQVGTGNFTHYKVIGPKDSVRKEVTKDLTKIKTPIGYSEDGGQTYEMLQPPKPVSSKRVQIIYDEDGGSNKDGVIELRKGVEDLSMGQSSYAQVRISVDGTHYLKGMAMYADDLPDGIDIRFNTNKKKGTEMLGPDNDHSVLKLQKEDPNNPNNPFGATITRQTGALNIVNEEGVWSDKWSNTLSSQVLSKQPPALAKKQLTIDYKAREEEFNRIMALENPAIKQKLLESFASECDSAAVHLKAAALPRQAWHVILPVDSMKDNEVYAPGYHDGEKVVLIRYPHAGRFEIPELTVNNKNPQAKSVLGDHPKDAIGINASVAKRLSGADFDGDTVLVIPNDSGAIKTAPSLKGLKDFDPQRYYPAYEGMPKVSPETGFRKGYQMGVVSNLITDMTIGGASMDEIARAVRHSMVVIDAEKHNLNWRQSEKDNRIQDLKDRYQGGGGASTLISQAKNTERVPHRSKGVFVTDPVTGKTKKLYTDPDTGETLWSDSGRTYFKPKTNKKTGEITEWVEVSKQSKVTKMESVKDAFELSSGSQIEAVYAQYANDMKALGNKARLEATKVVPTKLDREARKKYKAEYDSLSEKLVTARMNAPRERQAQALANARIRQTKKDNPDMDADEVSKKKAQYLTQARIETGAKKHQVEITDREWEAIQSGAISFTMQKAILNNTDQEAFKQRATPKQTKGLTSSQLARARSMLNSGYPQSEVAEALGVSVKTLMTSVNGE